MFVLALLVYWKGISLRVKMRGKIQFSMSILGLHCHAMKNNNANHSIQKD